LGWDGGGWDSSARQTPKTFLKPFTGACPGRSAYDKTLGEDQEAALTEAVKLVETGLRGTEWESLEGAQVCIFEDTPAG